MNIVEIVIITLLSFLFFILFLFLNMYIFKVKKIMNENENISEMLNIIMFDFKERLNKQNFCIMNQQIKIDIFELKLKEANQLLNLNKQNVNNKYTPLKESINKNTLINSKKFSNDITHLQLNMQSKENNDDNKLNQTEMKILKLFLNKNYSSREIQTETKQSREHTARILKKLFNQGLLVRFNHKKPYTYELSQKAKNILK